MRINFLVLFVLLYSCSNGTKKETPIDSHVYKDHTLIDALNKEIAVNLISEGQRLNKNLTLYDLNKKEWLNFEKIMNTKQLYFYFGNTSCNTCVDRELDMIKQTYKLHEVIIIGRDKEIRNLSVLMKNKDFKFRTYYVKPFDSLGMESEKLNNPIFFKLNRETKPYNLYIPKFSYPEFSVQYHKSQRIFFDHS